MLPANRRVIFDRKYQLDILERGGLSKTGLYFDYAWSSGVAGYQADDRFSHMVQYLDSRVNSLMDIPKNG